MLILLYLSSSLNGVPLAYDSIRVVGQHGHIYDDSGFIHMDIEANFIVFQPKTGQKLLVRNAVFISCSFFNSSFIKLC